MNRSIFSRSTVLALVFSCIASIAFADDTSNKNKFTETAKQKAKQGVEWTAKKCEALKQEWQEAVARGKVKGHEFFDGARGRIDKAFSKHDENNPQPTRPVIEEPTDVLELKVPFEVPAHAKPTGSEPIKRGGAVVTQEVIGGETVEMTSIDLSQDLSWLEWLSTEEGRKYGIGAIGVITVVGVTYVLYRNRVPQRIYRYVAQNPVKSLVTTACVLCFAAYVAHANGVTPESIKDKFSVPTPA